VIFLSGSESVQISLLLIHICIAIVYLITMRVGLGVYPITMRVGLGVYLITIRVGLGVYLITMRVRLGSH